MSLLRRAASNARELRYISYGQGDPYAIPNNGSLANYANSGVPVDTNTSMSLAAVWTSVRIISTVIASMPVYTCKMDGRREIRVADHPLVSNPFGSDSGDPISRQVGLEQVMGSMLLRGNSINLVANVDRAGSPTQLVPVSPDYVRIDRDNQSGAKVVTIGGKQVPLDQIVHIMGQSLPGQVQGMSPISYLRQTIGLGIATEEFGARFFGQGAQMSGIITMDGDLDPDAAKQLKERFSTRHAGLRNAHSVGVLTGGAKWQAISVAPEDAQFLATRQFNAAQVFSIYGIPPHLAGNVQDVSTSWGSGIEQQNMAFLTYTLRPWITRLEEAFTNMLPSGLFMRFDTDDLLRTDSQTRARFYNAGRQGGWMLIDQIREREGWDPIPGGDDPFAPLNSAHNGQNDQTTVDANQGKE